MNMVGFVSMMSANMDLHVRMFVVYDDQKFGEA